MRYPADRNALALRILQARYGQDYTDLQEVEKETRRLDEKEIREITDELRKNILKRCFS